MVDFLVGGDNYAGGGYGGDCGSDEDGEVRD